MLMSSNPAMSDEIESLEDIRWNHRIILGSTLDPEPVLAALSAREDELRDRDLLYFLVAHATRYSNASIAQSEAFWKQVAGHLNASNFVLIGRDGGVKARYGDLDLGAVFALIDTMPMRLREMSSGESR